MLGEHIRKMRKELNMTLTDFAEATDLSAGYLSQVERGLADPSLTSLQRIADALKIPPMLLLDNNTSDKSLLITKDRQPLVSIPETDNVKYRLCSPLPSSEFMPSSLVLEFFIEPLKQDFDKPIYHDTEEIIIVTKGSVTVMRMGEPVDLNVGDTLVLRKNVPHVIINRSDEVATGYSIMTPAIWTLNS